MYVNVNRDTVLNNTFWVLIFLMLLMVNVWVYADTDDSQQIPK